MKTKIYAHKSGPVSKAFLKVAALFSDEFEMVADQKLAGIVLAVGTEDLRAVYNTNQHFCVFLLGLA